MMTPDRARKWIDLTKEMLADESEFANAPKVKRILVSLVANLELELEKVISKC